MILFLWVLLVYLLYLFALSWSSSCLLLLTTVDNVEAAILRLDEALTDTLESNLNNCNNVTWHKELLSIHFVKVGFHDIVTR
jgi:hypothetical protein